MEAVMKVKREAVATKDDMQRTTHSVGIVMSDVVGLTKRDSSRKSFVIPGYLFVNRGDKVTWTARGTGARLIFPNDELFEPNDEFFETNEGYIRDGESVSLIVSNRARRKRRYPYAVITDSNKDFAIGGSYPVIIVQ
jgi:hypothetical protein